MLVSQIQVGLKFKIYKQISRGLKIIIFASNLLESDPFSYCVVSEHYLGLFQDRRAQDSNKRKIIKYFFVNVIFKSKEIMYIFSSYS